MRDLIRIISIDNRIIGEMGTALILILIKSYTQSWIRCFGNYVAFTCGNWRSILLFAPSRYRPDIMQALSS